jgi:MFS family permease
MGKVPAALPLLREDMGLSLVQAGLVVSTYAILVALAGLALGLLVAAVGYVRFAVVGILLAAIGSLLGAQAQSLSWLLFSRAVEGGGWVLAVVALPAMLSQFGTERDRPLIMGLWGAFVPVGAGSMLLLAPLLQAVGGWRLSWLCAGIASLLAAAVVIRICHVNRGLLVSLAASSVRPPVTDLRKPVAYIISLCFFCYSFQFVAVTSFLPTLLIEHLHLSLGSASRWAAIVVLANAIGNVAAGWLLRHGVARHKLLSIAALTIGLMAMLVYFDILPLAARLAAAIIFSVVGGLIPGTLFATVPLVATVPASVGVLVGLMLQFSGIGQWLGPVALPVIVEHFGSWSAAGVLMLIVGIVGSVAAIGLRGVGHRQLN